MEKNKLITVEVAFALVDKQVIIPVEVAAHATIKDAIERSGILHQFPDIDLSQNKVGIFSKLGKLDTPLKPGDRVEIYRTLIADPKEVRKQRAGQRPKNDSGS